MIKRTKQPKQKTIIVKSLKEFKEIYLPQKDNSEFYNMSDPKKLGIVIANDIYEKNKHILFESN